MPESRRNVLVGLFVLVGLVALGALIVLFGRAPTWFTVSKDYVLNAHFESASGIKEGTLVTVGGVTVGRVFSVNFRDRERFDLGVNVVLALSPGYRMRTGTRAVTTEPGLGMGRPPIQLTSPPGGVGDFLESGATIPGEMIPAVDALFPATVRANFERTAVQIGEAAEALTPVLNDLHILMQPRSVSEVDRPGGPQGNLSSAMARMDAMLRHANEVLGDEQTKSKLRESVDNLYTVTADFRTAAADVREFSKALPDLATEGRALVAETRQAVAGVNDNVERLSRGTLGAVNQASSFLTELTRIAQRASAGEGSLGKFLTDDRGYESMVLTFRRMAEMAEEFKVLARLWQEGRVKVAF